MTSGTARAALGRPTPLYDGTRLDAVAVTVFAASVLWRASCSREHLAKVRFSAPFHERFRAYFLGLTSFPASAALIVSLLTPPPGMPLDQVLFMPSTQQHDEHEVHSFTCAGFKFVLFLGRGIPGPVPDYCFASTRRILPDDGASVVDGLERLMRTAIPKGKLAKGLDEGPLVKGWK